MFLVLVCTGGCELVGVLCNGYPNSVLLRSFLPDSCNRGEASLGFENGQLLLRSCGQVVLLCVSVLLKGLLYSVCQDDLADGEYWRQFAVFSEAKSPMLGVVVVVRDSEKDKVLVGETDVRLLSKLCFIDDLVVFDERQMPMYFLDGHVWLSSDHHLHLECLTPVGKVEVELS